jgi:mycothiol synthase
MDGPLIRPYAADDAATVARMLADAQTLDDTLLGPTEAAWRGFTQLSFNLAARDFLVAEDQQHLVAVATSTLLDPPCRHFRIIVHPSWRRRGIATGLLARIESQALSIGGMFQCNSKRTWQAGNAFLEAHGFARTGGDLLMRWRGEARLIPDADIRAYRGGTADDAAWIGLHRAGYGHEAQFQPLTSSDLEVSRLAAGFALQFAERDGEVVGMCHAARFDDGRAGFIESLVVAEAHRGRGIGARLLAAGVAALVRDGCAAVELNVRNDNRPAIAAYERFGFAVYDEQYTYRRENARPLYPDPFDER